MKKTIHRLTFWLSMALVWGCDSSDSHTASQVPFSLEVADDVFTTEVNEPILLDLLTNDDISHQATVSITEAGRYGQIEAMPHSTQFQYHPSKNFSGYDTLGYEVASVHQVRQAKIYVTIRDSDRRYAIQASDDQASIKPHQPHTIAIGENDQHWELDTEIRITHQPKHGIISVNHQAQTLTYYPHLGRMNIYDTVSYQVYSSPLNHDEAQAIIHIDDDCQAYYLCIDDTIALGSNPSGSYLIHNFLYNDMKCEEDEYDLSSCQIMQYPTHGKLEYNPATYRFNYQAGNNRPYKDVFTYKICNMLGTCASADVVIYAD